MKAVTFSCIAVCLVGCGESSNAQLSNAVKIELNKVLFNIPSKYVLPGLPSTMVPSKGLDGGGGVSLKIPFDDLGVSKKGSLIVLLSKPSEYVTEFGVSIDAYNAWKGLELYADRIVEKDNDVGLFRVGSKAAYPMFWHYFTASPSDKAQPRDTWVASCYEAADGKSMCSKQFVSSHTESTLTLPGVYVENLSGFEDAYRAMLASWLSIKYSGAPIK